MEYLKSLFATFKAFIKRQANKLVNVIEPHTSAVYDQLNVPGAKRASLKNWSIAIAAVVIVPGIIGYAIGAVIGTAITAAIASVSAAAGITVIGVLFTLFMVWLAFWVINMILAIVFLARHA